MKEQEETKIARDQVKNDNMIHSTRSDVEREELKSYIFLDTDIRCEDPVFIDAVQKVGTIDLGWSMKTARGKVTKGYLRKEKQLHCLMFNLLIGIKAGKFIGMSRDQGFYSKNKGRYNKSGITKNIIKVSDLMVDAELLTMAKGTKNINSDMGFSTKIKTTSHFEAMLLGLDIKTPGTKPKGSEIIILKAENKKTYSTRIIVDPNVKTVFCSI